MVGRKKSSSGKKKTTKSKKSKKSTGKIGHARGKRKRAIARATVRKGRGVIRINDRKIDAYFPNKYLLSIATEPINFLGKEANEIDIQVNIRGGGISGQAQATRTAIAKALVNYFESEELKRKMEEYDRSLLVEDPRRVEPKKYKGPKARARFQKSYR